MSGVEEAPVVHTVLVQKNRHDGGDAWTYSTSGLTNNTDQQVAVAVTKAGHQYLQRQKKQDQKARNTDNTP